MLWTEVETEHWAIFSLILLLQTKEVIKSSKNSLASEVLELALGPQTVDNKVVPV